MFLLLILSCMCVFVFPTDAIATERTQTRASCKSRTDVCMNIYNCPAYAKRLKERPLPRYFLLKMKANLCGFVDNKTPKVCCTRTTPELSSHRNEHHLLPWDICGPIAHGARIVNGATTSPKEFPWMALIAYQTGDDYEDQDFKCGGSLINENYVLTAAHCLHDKDVLGVRLGEYDITFEKECDHSGQNCAPPVQDILIDKIIIHEDYDSTTFVNDIALIRLTTPANLTNDNVRPICLPTGDLQKANLLGKFLTVTGWGTTETGHKSMILSKVSIPVVPLNKCRKLYKFAPISKNQLCAGGYKGRDSCSGDSGGPLQYIAQVGESHKYVQDGIVSYGSKQCGIEGRPAIYTNVKEYMSWILDHIEP